MSESLQPVAVEHPEPCATSAADSPETPETDPQPEAGATGATEESPKSNQATQLLEMLNSEPPEDRELFRSEDDRAFFALKGRHYQCPSKALESRLKLYWLEMKGTVSGRDTAKGVMDTLEAIALTDPDIPTRSVHVRHAYIVDPDTGATTIYIDLCERNNRRAIEIDAKGFRIVEDPPVIFIRPAGVLPLPKPSRDSKNHAKALKALAKLLRVRSDEYTTLLMFLISAIAPSKLRFILSLGGDAGSGKTTTARILRSMIDPSIHMEAVKPSKMIDFYVLGQHTYVYCIDNLSGIPVWLSDALCCLATGASQHVRQLYTNDGIHTFRYSRTVILTSIGDLIWRQDLGSRSLSLRVPAITDDGLAEEAIDAEIERIRPHVLGALCEAASYALRKPQAGLVKHRMQALADWTVSAAPSLGLAVEDIANSVNAAVEDLNATHLESSPIVEPLRNWALNEINGGSWTFDHVLTKTTADLLEELNQIATDAQKKTEHWPKSSRTLGNRLAEIAPSLPGTGITVTPYRKSQIRGWTIDFSEFASAVELPTRQSLKRKREEGC